MVLVAAYLLVTMYGGSKYKQGRADEATAWAKVVAEGEKQKLIAYQDGVASVGRAETVYHETVRDRIIPVTKTLIERVTEYAQTADGAELCLPVERVRLLDETRGALFPDTDPRATGGEPRGVQPGSSEPH